MLNREDIRKVLEAHRVVMENISNDDKKEDISFRELQELILGEIQSKEKEKDL